MSSSVTGMPTSTAPRGPACATAVGAACQQAPGRAARALKAAWRLGRTATDDYMRAVDLRPVNGSRLPTGRDVNQDELAALLATCRRRQSGSNAAERSTSPSRCAHLFEGGRATLLR